MLTRPDPVGSYEPRFTWTFSRRSLVIRSYLWLYEADRSQVNFCKLFWGMLLSPLTLPIRLALLAGRGLKYPALWLARAISVIAKWVSVLTLDPFGDWLVKRDKAAVKTKAEREAALTKRINEELLAEEWLGYLGLREQGPRPRRPSAASRFADRVAIYYDKMAAFFQAHPQIAVRTDRIASFLGKAFTRCVFYPLLVLLPVGTLGFLGWQVEQHYHGVTHPALWMTDHLRHWSWVGLFRGSEFIGLIAASAVVCAALVGVMIGFIWGLDKVFSRVIPKPAPIVIPSMADDPFVRWLTRRHDDKLRTMASDEWQLAKEKQRLKWERSIVRQEAFYRMMASSWRVARLIIHPVAWVLALPFRLIGYLALGIYLFLIRPAGRALKRTGHAVAEDIPVAAIGFGKFMTMGHHAVKSRTCPRIEVTE